MALIICPECGKEISDKAKACIHCGFPLDSINDLDPTPTEENMNICPKCGKIYTKLTCPDCGTGMINCHISQWDWTKKINMQDKDDEWTQQMRERYVVNSTVFDKDLYEARLQEEQAERDKIEEYRQAARRIEANKPKCPTCGSTNVEKISTTSKVVGGALFGLFSSNVRNTMRCKHCGYKW